VTNQRLFPVQAPPRARAAQIPESVYMSAYEVYAHVYGPQEALVDLARGCRGGFSSGELVAFLYARAYPKEQWHMKVDEAFRGATL
jgi:hypothetical protein